ncbi:MAG: hypothetical protein ACFFDT_21610, partial [Candidatus Hodarchaeota archaeon]
LSSMSKPLDGNMHIKTGLKRLLMEQQSFVIQHISQYGQFLRMEILHLEHHSHQVMELVLQFKQDIPIE